MRTCRRWGKSLHMTCPHVDRTSHITLSQMILSKSPSYSLTHKQTLLKKGIFFLIPVAFSLHLCEQLDVIALWPLSHHRHDHRNPQPFVYRRAPVYGLMVILIVCLWHEPDSQLLAWAWHRGHRDRWQPNAFYCLPLPLALITSVVKTAGATWYESLSLSLHTCLMCCMCCIYVHLYCVCVCP